MRHLKTKKHKLNCNNKQIVNENSLICPYCAKSFKHQSSLSKHVNHTCKYNKDEKLPNIVKKIIQEENMKREREFVKMKLQINELYKKLEDINKRIGGFYSLI